MITRCTCKGPIVGIEVGKEGADGKDGRRGTYDKERRALVATDDGDILATTTTTRRTRGTRPATPLIAVVDRRLTAAVSSRSVAASSFPVQQRSDNREKSSRVRTPWSSVRADGQSLGTSSRTLPRVRGAAPRMPTPATCPRGTRPVVI